MFRHVFYWLTHVVLMLFFISSGCDSTFDEGKALRKNLLSYIYEESGGIESDAFIIRVDKEVIKERGLVAFRFSAQEPYLPDSLLPDSLSYINGHLVFYMNMLDVDDREHEAISSELFDKGYINNDKAYTVKTNYPEWVWFYSVDKEFLLKDTGYLPIEKLVNQLLL